ncbi:MAG: hypothetical protein H6667_07995 [Ardenticatenaceae bacterium]|nr:hypothetical protein [Ardenticatenaceae bacterium]MCB9444661.1 hypothetical protein [Ardenticatenaceae bacterium]
MMRIQKMIKRLRERWQNYWTRSYKDEYFATEMSDSQQALPPDANWVVLAPDDYYEEPFLSGDEDMIIVPDVHYIDEQGAVIGSSISSMTLDHGYIAPPEYVFIGGE